MRIGTEGRATGCVTGGPVVERGRRGQSEAINDRALLWWVGRFRFVTSRELAVRFGVTEQRVNTRARRLIGAGLLGAMRAHNNARRLVFLTRRGSMTLGLGERRAPRTDVQVRHELAIVMLVARLEQGLPLGRSLVLTERECRRAERETGRPWSASVYYQGRRQRRWPDLVALIDGKRRAIELELTPKHTPRLEAIIRAYRYSEFNEVLWLTDVEPLRRRLEGLCRPMYETDTPMRVRLVTSA